MSDLNAPFGVGDDGKPLAPHGYTAKGTIKMDGRGRPAKTTTRRGAAAKRPPAAPKPAGSTRKQNHTETIEMALHIVLTPAAMVPAISLDVAPFMEHATNLAKAGNEVVQHYPAALEFITGVATKGPLMILFGALLPPLAQVAANHNWLPPEMTSRFGAVPPAQYAARLHEKAAQMQQQAAAQVPDQASSGQVNGHAPAFV